jgi:excinuclease ABC subunit A
VRGRKGEYRKELAQWQKDGFTRVRIDGQFYAIEDAPALDKKYKHDIEVVVDRIVVRIPGWRGRHRDAAGGLPRNRAQARRRAGLPRPRRSPNPPPLSLSLSKACPVSSAPQGGKDSPSTSSGRAGGGDREVLQTNAPPGRITFSEKFACPVSGFTIAEIEPRLFSFNAPAGRLPGLRRPRREMLFDPELVVPNENLSLKQGAIVPWAKSNPPSPYYMQVLASLARAYEFDLTTPWNALTDEQRRVILHGTDGKPVTLTFIDGRKSYDVKKAFEGVIGNLNRRMLQTEAPGCARSSPNTKAPPRARPATARACAPSRSP